MNFLKIDDKWMIFTATSLANFLATFTTSSINLALPGMAAEFGVSMGAISWVSLIYMLTLSCSLMMFGRLGDLYGYKRLYVTGYSLFAIVSLLLPLLSANMLILVFLRSLQAIGGSMLVSITYALVSRSFPVEERGKALGINSIFVSVGLAMGPSLGGWLVTNFSWQSLFYINLPFCILGVLASMRYIKDNSHNNKVAVKMDWLGVFTFGVMIFALSMAINFVDEWGFISAKFLGCLGIALLSLVFFIKQEQRSTEPLMQLFLFKNKKFTCSITASLFSYLAQQMTTFLMPFFLLTMLLMNQDKAGLIMLSTPLFMMLSSPIGGRLTDRFGSKQPALVGLFSVALGCGLMSGLGLSATLPYIMVALALFGIGNGLSVAAINTAIICSIPSEHTGVASGMSSTIRNIGQSLGVAVGGMIIEMRSLVYARQAQLSEAAVYLNAQRDAFIFGVVAALLAFIAIALIPNVQRCQR